MTSRASAVATTLMTVGDTENAPRMTKQNREVGGDSCGTYATVDQSRSTATSEQRASAACSDPRRRVEGNGPESLAQCRGR